MAKDYFQDIVPPSDGQPHRLDARNLRPLSKASQRPAPVPAAMQEEEDIPEATDEYTEDDITPVDVKPAPRGIRNINIQTRPRSRPMGGDRGDGREVPSIGRGLPPRPRRTFSRAWLWVLAVLCLVVLGFFALFIFRQTTITLTPRTQAVTFDQTAQFTAYPAASVATGTLPYTVATTDLTDSESVQGNGVTATQMKASGSITVYNAYSASSVKLIQDTRFETPAGLIFRVPDDIVIPGKVGSTPGHVTVTVVADQAGQQYDIGPTSRFTVPGLQSTPSEYSEVYAVSTGSMTGGFSGNQEGVSDSVRESAVADIRTRLAQDVAQYVQSQNSSAMTAFASLAQITYTDLPDTDGTSTTQVVINESAHVEVPVFPAVAFASAVAQTTAVTTDNSPVTLVAGAGYAAQSTDSTPVNLGTDPLDFALTGSAEFIWSIDTEALTQALAGRSQSVFQTVISGFPGIEAAKARIEPFWETSFPSDPSKIKIIVEDSGASSTSATGSSGQ